MSTDDVSVMYRVHPWKSEIKAVDVVTRTNCFVTYREDEWPGRPLRKVRIEGEFFDTWEAAHAALTERVSKAIERAKQALQVHRSELGKIESMRKPA